MLRRFHPVPIVLLFVGLLATFAALTQRYLVEADNRRVALVLDYQEIRQLAAATGTPLVDALRQFRGAGATGVAITERTLAELQSADLLDVQVAAAPGGREYRVAFADPALAEQVADYVSRYVLGATETAPVGDRVVLPGPGGGQIYLPGSFADIEATPTGLDAEALAAVRTADLEPVARLQNPLGLTEESLRWTLGRVKDAGAKTLVFAGDEVLGFRGLLKQTAQTIRDLDLQYGTVEFGKQRGDQTLSTLLEDRLVRVHSISPGEMSRLAPSEAIERYVRAATERNIRMNYVRLPSAPTENTFATQRDYMQSLARQVANTGLGLSTATAFDPVWPNEMQGRIVAAGIAFGIAGGTVLLLAGLVPLSGGIIISLSLLLAAVCGALAFSGMKLGLQLVALLGALVFPALGLVLYPQPVGAFEEHEHAAVRERSEAIVPAVAEFSLISFITLIGALMVAGLLSQLPFMVKTASFAGIKAATVIPLLLIAWVYLTGMSGQYPSRDAERRAVVRRLQHFLSEPVRVWHTVALLVGLIALALLVARSGNDSGVGVSDLELRFRSLLDRLLGVRPRTKEFLIGHPAMLLGLAMATLPRWRVWAFPLLLLGMIGQVGMLNTFCHLHTPLKLSLLRTFHGLWIGGLIGCILVAVWLFLLRKTRPHERLRL